MPPGIKFLTLVTSSNNRGTQSEQMETLKTPGWQSPVIPQSSEGTPQTASSVLRPELCQPTSSPSWLWSHVLVIWIVALKLSLQQGFQPLLPRSRVSEVPSFPLDPIYKLRVCLPHTPPSSFHRVPLFECPMASASRELRSRAKKELRLTKPSWF